jgi:hypothetical protein
VEDIETQTQSAEHHERLVQRKVRDSADIGHVLEVQGRPYPLFPDLGPAEARDDVDGDDEEDAFDGAREVAEEEDAGVVFLPGGEVEVGEGGDLGGDGPPGAPQAECAAGEETFEGRVEGVAAYRTD